MNACRRVLTRSVETEHRAASGIPRALAGGGGYVHDQRGQGEEDDTSM